MRKERTHVSKTIPERDYYSKYIKSKDYEPTVDETLHFPSTDDDKKDFSNQKTNKKRKVSLQQQLSDHFEENWIKWVGGVIACVLLWLMFDSKLSINGIEYKVSSMQDDIKELKQTNKETNEHLQKQDLNIREHQVRIETLQKGNEEPNLNDKKKIK